MKFSVIRTALLTLLAVITPAVVVNADCYKDGRGHPKEPIWWLKQALVAAARVERSGWIESGKEFWTSGKPGSSSLTPQDGKGNEACVDLGVKNHDKNKVKINAQYALNHWMREFAACDNGGHRKNGDDLEFFYKTTCNEGDTKTDEIKDDGKKDEL